MRSARRLYRLTLGLALVGAVAVAVGFAAGVGAVDFGGPSVERMAAACGRFLLPDLAAFVAAAATDLYAALGDGTIKQSGDGGRSWTVRSTP
jgi:hypothetical protein